MAAGGEKAPDEPDGSKPALALGPLLLSAGAGAGAALVPGPGVPDAPGATPALDEPRGSRPAGSTILVAPSSSKRAAMKTIAPNVRLLAWDPAGAGLSLIHI